MRLNLMQMAKRPIVTLYAFKLNLFCYFCLFAALLSLKKDGCSLHVYGYSDGMDFFYSTPESLGIMTANGNIGQQLTRMSDGYSIL
jgi:hypothetical protein